VTIDYELCIGCAYCEVACPYQARFLVDAPRFAYGAALQSEIEREDPARLGVAQKCTFCSDRIDFGLANGLTPGVEPLATPACVNSCIADALHFGDLDDPHSNVSRLLREQKHFRMHEELGTEPSFFYLYARADDNDSQAESRPSEPREEKPQTIRTRGVEPWHQPHWNWKAAANFLCGGAGSGLLAVAAVITVAGELFTMSAPIGLVSFPKIPSDLNWHDEVESLHRQWRCLRSFMHSGCSSPTCSSRIVGSKPRTSFSVIS